MNVTNANSRDIDMELRSIAEEDQVAMRKAMTEFEAAEKVETARCNRVLAQVRSVVSDAMYREILEEMSDSFCFDYHITSAPTGVEQDDDASWGKTFVNQTTNGGLTGDEYAGTVSIPLSEGQFFQFGYSM